MLKCEAERRASANSKGPYGKNLDPIVALLQVVSSCPGPIGPLDALMPTDQAQAVRVEQSDAEHACT